MSLVVFAAAAVVLLAVLSIWTLRRSGVQLTRSHAAQLIGEWLRMLTGGR